MKHALNLFLPLIGVGLALLGAVTGSFSAWLLQVFSREEDDRPRGS